ncbi:MAG: ATP-binding protein [Kiritimatiellia bacterium]
MSFLFEKKTEHESLCEAAIKGGRTAEAVFHAAKAADFAFALAKQTGGSVGDRYLANAESWLEIAERLKKSPLSASNGPNTEHQKTNTKNPIPNTESASPANDDEFQVTEKPTVCFDDIAGMEEAKDSIFDMVVYPMREPEKARKLKLKPGGGVLLYGPPGNGKTMLGKAIAHEIEAPFFYASGAQIRSKWHGESEQRLSRLIQSAQSRPVAVLFLDEVDGLLPRRSSGSSVVDNRVVTQFLADIGGFKDSNNVLLLLGATNKPWEIDEAVFRTGRFDEKIYIGMPDLPARLGLLKRHLDGLPLEAVFDYQHWADRLNGYTGSDIVGIVHDAKRTALRRSILEKTDPIIIATDLDAAFKTIPSSVTERMLKQYEQFREQRFG